MNCPIFALRYLTFCSAQRWAETANEGTSVRHSAKSTSHDLKARPGISGIIGQLLIVQREVISLF